MVNQQQSKKSVISSKVHTQGAQFSQNIAKFKEIAKLATGQKTFISWSKNYPLPVQKRTQFSFQTLVLTEVQLGPQTLQK